MKSEEVNRLKEELSRLEKWENNMVGEQRAVVEKANAVREKCQQDIKTAKKAARKARKEKKEANEAKYHTMVEHRKEKAEQIAEYTSIEVSTEKTLAQEVGLVHHLRSVEVLERKDA